MLTKPTIAFFDLDKTLIPRDSDHQWGEFLTHHGYVDANYYQQKNDYFYQEYINGVLDIHEYAEFSYKVLKDNTPEQLNQWHAQFMFEYIESMIAPQALELVQKHKNSGHTVVLTSATNDFIASPIAARLGIDHVIATQAEQIEGRYTGKVAGTPNFQEGKVTRMTQWLQEQGLSWETIAASYGYSDSINDAPLLEQTTFAIATNPDARLKQLALQKHWAIIELFAS